MGQCKLGALLWTEKWEYLYVEFKNRPLKVSLITKIYAWIKRYKWEENKYVNNMYDNNAKTSVYGEW